MLMMIMDVIGILRLWNVRTSMRHNQALKECRRRMSSLTFRIYRGICRCFCSGNHHRRALKHGRGVVIGGCDDDVTDSSGSRTYRPRVWQPWSLMSTELTWVRKWRRRVCWKKTEMMNERDDHPTLPLPSLISTFIHFPFVFPYSYWRVQQSHIHISHSIPLGTPQRRRKCMITHWRGHFTHYISLSKVLVGCSHRIECVVMVACAIWDSYAWFVMIAPGRSCAVCDISQCHRMKWDAQSQQQSLTEMVWRSLGESRNNRDSPSYLHSTHFRWE